MLFMPAGDAQRTWFPEMVETLRMRWRASMSIPELIKLRGQLDSMHGGAPLGIARFEAKTGVKSSDWMGKFWVRWGDALVEAGFRPNALQGPRSDDDLLESLALFARELGHFPVVNEIKLKARTEPGFPWPNTFARFGGNQRLAARLHEFAVNRGHEDVAKLCDAVFARPSKRGADTGDDAAVEAESNLGYVYLLKSGRFWLRRVWGYRVGWVAMRRNLLRQADAENHNKQFNLELELISMFDKCPPAVDLLVVDEAQHDAAQSMCDIHALIRPEQPSLASARV
jgi:hypothetical protein